jgi:hypothetical protein
MSHSGGFAGFSISAFAKMWFWAALHGFCSLDVGCSMLDVGC